MNCRAAKCSCITFHIFKHRLRNLCFMSIKIKSKSSLSLNSAICQRFNGCPSFSSTFALATKYSTVWLTVAAHTSTPVSRSCCVCILFHSRNAPTQPIQITESISLSTHNLFEESQDTHLQSFRQDPKL